MKAILWHLPRETEEDNKKTVMRADTSVNIQTMNLPKSKSFITTTNLHDYFKTKRM
jgi:hypothetical protein